MPGKWDGKSRISNDKYRQNFDRIFKTNPIINIFVVIIRSTFTALNKRNTSIIDAINGVNAPKKISVLLVGEIKNPSKRIKKKKVKNLYNGFIFYS